MYGQRPLQSNKSNQLGAAARSEELGDVPRARQCMLRIGSDLDLGSGSSSAVARSQLNKTGIVEGGDFELGQAALADAKIVARPAERKSCSASSTRCRYRATTVSRSSASGSGPVSR